MKCYVVVLALRKGCKEAPSSKDQSVSAFNSGELMLFRAIASMDVYGLDLAALVLRTVVSDRERLQSEASLQVSCLTEEIQKLMNSNQQLKSDISNEMKPVLLVCPLMETIQVLERQNNGAC